jgi:hypothetical protein
MEENVMQPTAQLPANRTCQVCGASLAERRPQARSCSGPCRAELSRRRRLEAGIPADGFTSLADREQRRRQRNRTDAAHAPRIEDVMKLAQRER